MVDLGGGRAEVRDDFASGAGRDVPVEVTGSDATELSRRRAGSFCSQLGCVASSSGAADRELRCGSVERARRP